MGGQNLLAVLILSFAVWGIGDMFLGGTGSDAVKAAGKSSTFRTFLVSRTECRPIRQQIDPALDQQTIRLGALHQAVQAVTTRETSHDSPMSSVSPLTMRP